MKLKRLLETIEKELILSSTNNNFLNEIQSHNNYFNDNKKILLNEMIHGDVFKIIIDKENPYDLKDIFFRKSKKITEEDYNNLLYVEENGSTLYVDFCFELYYNYLIRKQKLSKKEALKEMIEILKKFKEGEIDWRVRTFDPKFKNKFIYGWVKWSFLTPLTKDDILQLIENYKLYSEF